jgi:hypothetical protein
MGSLTSHNLIGPPWPVTEIALLFLGFKSKKPALKKQLHLIGFLHFNPEAGSDTLLPNVG